MRKFMALALIAAFFAATDAEAQRLIRDGKNKKAAKAEAADEASGEILIELKLPDRAHALVPGSRTKRFIRYGLSHPDASGDYVRVTTSGGRIVERGVNVKLRVSRDGKTLWLVVPNSAIESTIGFDEALGVDFEDKTPYHTNSPVGLPSVKMKHYEVRLADYSLKGEGGGKGRILKAGGLLKKGDGERALKGELPPKKK